MTSLSDDRVVIKTIKLINLTFNEISVCTPDGKVYYKLKPEPISARCQERRVEIDTMMTPEGILIPITSIQYGDVSGLPDPQEGVSYIVPLLVAQACPTRTDLLVPGTIKQDEHRNIVGCVGLSITQK